MRASFDEKVVAACAFLIICSAGAGILGTMNAPAASARGVQTGITEVNRADKTDRLTALPARQAPQRLSQPAQAAKTSFQRPPLGCDPAFSPVAEPTRAGIYKRCTV